MKIDATHYLDYLEKEMHIMGVLSTFSLAVPSLIIERVASLEDKSLAYNFFATLLQKSSPLLVVASILMLTAAAFFYRQRSRLGFHYGQIALEIAIPEYTKIELKERLKTADSWKVWVPYHLAKSAIIFAVIGYICSSLSVCVCFIYAHCLLLAILLVGMYMALCWWIYCNSCKYNYDDKIHIPLID
jgi:hypothetical protein